jgi:hypothetical protein
MKRRLALCAGIALCVTTALASAIRQSVTTLEEWFDPARLCDDFQPSGFRGHKTTRRAVPGHTFGLTLNAEEKAALIAFLKTL